MAMTCDLTTNLECSSATGHDDPQIYGQNLQLGKIIGSQKTNPRVTPCNSLKGRVL